MPTYQYACTNADCGERFERVQAFTDPAVSQCPVCGSPVRKVYGSVGVVFKGSGFYRTDSRSGGTSGDGLAASSGTSAKEGSSSGSSGSGASSAGSGSSSGSGASSAGSGTSSPGSSSSGSSSASAPTAASA